MRHQLDATDCDAILLYDLSKTHSFMAVSAAALVMVILAFTIFNLELADKAYVGLQRLISTRLAGYFGAWR